MKDTVVMQADNICMNYHDNEKSRDVVSSISFSVRKGEMLVIMGKSGCGKSTVLNILGSMLKPTAGSVIVDGQDICAFNDKQKNEYRRNRIGFVFQNYYLMNELTALENVMLASSMAKNPQSPEEMLRLVGLEEKLESLPNQMSGGEQQRVCLARALVKGADIILCDEPTGALDSENSQLVMKLLSDACRVQKVSVIVVTHNPDFKEIADHYIEISNGRIVAEEFLR